jgi:hypothetical protein
LTKSAWFDLATDNEIIKSKHLLRSPMTLGNMRELGSPYPLPQ